MYVYVFAFWNFQKYSQIWSDPKGEYVHIILYKGMLETRMKTIESMIFSREDLGVTNEKCMQLCTRYIYCITHVWKFN